MADEQLRYKVLQRADDDENLSEQARLLVLAAIGNPDDPTGLAEVAVAMSRLDDDVESLTEPSVVVGETREALRPTLQASDDPRAAIALALISKTPADLDAVAQLITDGVPTAWRESAVLTVPEAGELERASAALRSASAARADAERTVDALAADRVQFLETSLEFHDRHGTQPCPVCAETTLDDAWVVRARASLAAEQEAAGALRAARSGAHRARQTLAALIRAVDAPPVENAELATIAAARLAYEAFSVLPVDDDAALADHAERTLPDLRVAYDALRREAAALIDLNDDGWHAVAGGVAAWLEDAQADAAAAPKLKAATEAQSWLKNEIEQQR